MAINKGEFVSDYTDKIEKKFPIGKTKMESGMVVEIVYVMRDERGIPSPPQSYICLVLHPNHLSYVHLLRIDNINNVFFRQLVREVGLEPCKAYPQLIKLKVQKLLMEARDSRRFYIHKLKPYMSRKYNDSYRTFIMRNITYVKALKFNFNKL